MVPATRAKAQYALEVAASEEEVVVVVVVQATRVKDPSASLGEVAQEEVVVEVVRPVLEVCPSNNRPSRSPGHRRLNTSSVCRRDLWIQKTQDTNMPHISFSIKLKKICIIPLSSFLGFSCAASI